MPLSEVRDSVVASVRHERAMQRASDRANGILQQLNDGAEIAATAEAEGLELRELEGVGRTSGEVPTDLLEQVFKMPPPQGDEPRTTVLRMSDGYAVVQLEQVVDGNVEDIDLDKVRNYRTRIASAAANAETIGFLRMLRNQSEIEVFEDRL
jgi:peptidyl-prolyl cis-trans isomerase D